MHPYFTTYPSGGSTSHWYTGCVPLLELATLPLTDVVVVSPPAPPSPPDCSSTTFPPHAPPKSARPAAELSPIARKMARLSCENAERGIPVGSFYRGLRG